jgi:hypothetical protein
MEITYIGVHDAVEVDLPNGSTTPPIENGATYDFPPEFAQQLLEQQSNWQRPAAPKAPRTQAEANERAAELNVQFPDNVTTVAQKAAFLANLSAGADA